MGHEKVLLVLWAALVAALWGCPEDDPGDDDSASEQPVELRAPVDLEGLYVDDDYQLRWTDSNSGASGWQVLNRGAGADTFVEIGRVVAGTTAYLDTEYDADVEPVYQVCAVDGDRSGECAELDSTVRYWTYIRIIGYDSLWGDEGPTREQLIGWHLTWDMTEKAASADNFNLLLLGDWYGDEGSIWAHASATGNEIVEVDEINTGDVDDYRAFFDWAVDGYPGQHYVVSYWSHGGGSAVNLDTAIGYDDTDADSLDPEETGEALRYLADLTGRQVEVFSACACLTQMVENAYALRDAVRYFVAGETVVGCGCDALDVFWEEPDQSARQIADATVAAHHSDQYPNDVVFASVDLAEARSMAEEFDALALALSDYAGRGQAELEALRDAAGAAQNMNYMPGYPNIYSEYLDVVDLCDQLDTLGDETVSAAAASVRDFVQTDLLTSVMHQNDYEGLYPDAHGISILHPIPAYGWYDEEAYESLSFCQDTAWDEYIKGLF